MTFLIVGAPLWIWAPTALAEEWAFLPGISTFHPLIADPREPQTGVLAYTAESRFEGSVGTALEIVRYTPDDGTQWGWGFLGSAFILLDEYGATFPMRAADWYAGIYGAESFGVFSHRLEFVHQSAHLGDSLEGILEPIIYNGENFNYTASFQPSQPFRFTAGIGVWDNFFPHDNALFASLGAEVYTPAADFLDTFLRGYFTGFLKWKGQDGGVWNKTLQWGLQWKFREGDSRAVRLALVYFNGNSEFGQFYQQSDEHWAVGIYFDP